MIPACPLPPRHDVEDLPLQARAREHAIDEVRPIERSDELDRILEPELRRDVATNARRGGRRVGMEADAGKEAAEPAELPVLGTEVVPPLADAVRLVDGNELHVALRESRQKPVAALAGEPLRRDIQQSVATFAQAGRYRRLLVGAERAVVERGRHAVADERIDLILHQGDERRDDHAQSRPHQRRRLEAERLASSGREHDDRIAAGKDGVHRLPLERTKRGVAPVALEDMNQVVARGIRGSQGGKHSDALDDDERPVGRRLAKRFGFGILRGSRTTPSRVRRSGTRR